MTKGIVLADARHPTAAEYVPIERLTQRRVDRAIAEAVAAEREACAKVAESVVNVYDFDFDPPRTVLGATAKATIAAAIRARGEQRPFSEYANTAGGVTREELILKMRAMTADGTEAGNAEAEVPGRDAEDRNECDPVAAVPGL